MRILAYIKPTNYCNVGCDHCYLPLGDRSDRRKMNLDTMRKVAEFLSNFIKHDKRVDILWHGGEPLVLGPDWYYEASSVLDEFLGEHRQSIQTSLIPYRKEFSGLVKERFSSHIGSSIDFSQRKIGGSVEKYHDLWMKKVELARSDGITVVPGMVPSKKEIGRGFEIVDWLIAREFNIFNVDRYNQYGINSNDCPSNKEHSDFLWEIFEAVMKKMEKGCLIKVNVVDAVLRGVFFGDSGDRWGTKCQSNNIVINPDGSINSCPDRSVYERFSSVYDGFDNYISSPVRKKWIRIQTVGHVNQYCFDCENWNWCGSGCPITANDLYDQGDCSGYKSYINRVREFCKSKYGYDIAMAYVGGA